jgi:predicted PurR-regulated permease PerM
MISGMKELGVLEGSGVKKLFTNNWEKMALWAILIGLFYLLKPFFLLIFETFLITYSTKIVIQWSVIRMKMNYRLAAVIVFLLFVSLLGAASAWIVPKLILESNRIVKDFTGSGDQQTREKINGFVETIVVKVVGEEKAQSIIESDEYMAMMETLKSESAKAVKAALPRVLETLLHLVKFCWEILFTLVLAIIFSFILVMDWRRIAKNTKELEKSRIRSFYIGAAPHLQAFADVLGKAFTAQAIIAICNTLLTAAGIWFFQVPNIALIMTIVFLCGFIPIVGTFISSIPILIFGIQAGGLLMVFKLIILIAIVHAFEAYVLNPKITGNVLHVHPILVLILLLVGERFFGIWGMVVGVPIGYYVISVLTRKDESLAAAGPVL